MERMVIVLRWRVVALAWVLVATGCGSRLTYERLIADAQNGASAPGDAGSSPDGVAEDGIPGGGASAPTEAAAPRGDGAVAGDVGRGGLAAAGGMAPQAPKAAVVNPTDNPTGKAVGSGGGNPTVDDGRGSEPPAPGGGSSGKLACSEAKAPITIGQVGTSSGLVGSLLIGMVRAVQAWVASTNAKGGLNCHPVRYIVSDDGADPSRHQAEVRRLVEEDRVLAMVQMTAPLTGQASVDYLTSQRVPVIGGEGGDYGFYKSPMYFPQMSVGTALQEALVAASASVAVPQGKTQAAIVTCVEASVCSSFYETGSDYAPRVGLTVAYRARVSLVQPDYTATCQSAQSAGAQLVIVTLDPNAVTRFARSCARVNYHPLYAISAPSQVPQMASDPNLDGMIVAQYVLPWFASSHPAIGEYQDTLRQYAPGVHVSAQSVIGWVSAKLLEVAAQNGPDLPTSQSILDGLWSVKGNDLGGLTYPLSFTRDQNAEPALCFWVVLASGGQWVSPDGVVRTCRPSN